MALIERLEAASGPDRLLDAEIAPIMGLRIVDEGHPIGRVCYDANNHCVPLPSYTASIDAALTLVPEGWGTTIDTRKPPAAIVQPDDGRIGKDWSYAATPALALCIAALRAREADRG